MLKDQTYMTKKKKGDRRLSNFKITKTKTKLSSNNSGNSQDSPKSPKSPIKGSTKGGLQFGNLKRKEEELPANAIN